MLPTPEKPRTDDSRDAEATLATLLCPVPDDRPAPDGLLFELPVVGG